METLENKIKDFLAIGSGDGSGDGSGYGYGSGDGDGSGDGYGSGYGSGSGDGYGYGSGSGDGYGYGSGSGDGYGYGSGSGDGYGSGYGSGSGDGYGYGSGSGDGSSINHKKVYKIDGIPCVFDSVFADYAKVEVLRSDLTFEKMFVAKRGDFFAHGKTLKEAVHYAEAKYNENRPLSDRIAEFLKTFEKGKKYEGSLFFEWHHILTGSCLAGRNEFVKRKGLSKEALYTPEEFIALTENDYGGESIKELKKAMKL